MKANCKFLKTFLLAIILALGIGNVPDAKAQDTGWKPLMEINGIGYDKLDSVGTYWFYPLCQDSFCSGVQEHQYMYLWDFGKGRYSLEANPVMRFDHDVPTQVRLYVTGLKEIKDPDARKPLVRAVLDNCMVTDSFAGQVVLPRVSVERPKTTPEVKILQPSHPPVPGKCTDYLVQWDFAEDCRHSGQFELHGFIKDAAIAGMAITGYEASPGVHVERVDSTTLKVKLEETKDRTLQLLLHCKFSPLAKVEQTLQWQLRGKFSPARAHGCSTVPVDYGKEDRFEGSLDPSYLASCSSEQVKFGDTMMWDLRVRNDGNAPESYIEIVDTLPIEFAWNSLVLYSCTWAGRDHQPTIEVDAASRRILWTLNDDARPLQPGEYAHLQFKVRVDYHEACKEGWQGGDCVPSPTTGHRLHHTVWTMFRGEQISGLDVKQYPLSSDKTLILCEMACKPQPQVAPPVEIKIAWFPITITIVIAGLVVLYLLYLLAKARANRNKVV